MTTTKGKGWGRQFPPTPGSCLSCLLPFVFFFCPSFVFLSFVFLASMGLWGFCGQSLSSFPQPHGCACFLFCFFFVQAPSLWGDFALQPAKTKNHWGGAGRHLPLKVCFLHFLSPIQKALALPCCAPSEAGPCQTEKEGFWRFALCSCVWSHPFGACLFGLWCCAPFLWLEPSLLRLSRFPFFCVGAAFGFGLVLPPFA